MSFFGTDAAEKSGSATLNHQPQLDGSRSIEFQAKFISNFVASREDDLTFNERTVRDVSDRGRGKVVNDFMKGLATAFKKAQANRKAEQSAARAAAAAAGQPSSRVIQDVQVQLEALRGIRARSETADEASARPPLDQLALLPMDALTLKKTKVAAELNQDYWKLRAAPEVQRLVTSLIHKWRAIYRREEDGPSERTLRNSAVDLEEVAHSLAPRTQAYGQLVEAVIRRLSPELSLKILEGSESAKDIVGRIHKRHAAEKKNAGNPVPPPVTISQPKRPRLADERPLALEDQPAAARSIQGRDGQAAPARAPQPKEEQPPVPARATSSPAAHAAQRSSEPPLPPPSEPPPSEPPPVVQQSELQLPQPAAPRRTTFAARLTSSSHEIVLPI